MAGVSGNDAILVYGDTTSPTSVVANITSIGLPSRQVTDIDVTAMDSAGNNKEFVAGLVDNGEVSVELNYVKSNATTVESLVGVNGKYFMITIPAPTSGSTASYKFAGYVKGLGGAVPMDGAVTQTATIKVSGAITSA